MDVCNYYGHPRGKMSNSALASSASADSSDVGMLKST